MADVITISEAARRYRPSRSKILRDVQEVAENPNSKDRKYVLPSPVEYQAIKEKEERGEKPSWEFAVDTTLFDELGYERREEGDTPHQLSPAIEKLSDSAGAAVLSVLERDNEKLWEQMNEKDKQLAEKDRQLLEKDQQLARRDAEVKRKDKELLSMRKTLWRAADRNMKLTNEKAELMRQLPVGSVSNPISVDGQRGRERSGRTNGDDDQDLDLNASISPEESGGELNQQKELRDATKRGVLGRFFRIRRKREVAHVESGGKL